MRRRYWVTVLAVILVGTVMLPTAALAKPAKVDLCHWQPNRDAYRLIRVAERAVAEHVANHSDGSPGDPVPGMVGFEFGEDCSPELVAATVDLSGGDLVVEGDFAPFTLELDRAVDSDVVVRLQWFGVGDRPASVDDISGLFLMDSGGGFVEVAGNQLVVPAGVTSVDVFVGTKEDQGVEGTETFALRILDVSSPHAIGTDQTLGSIADNDNATIDLLGGDQVEEGQAVRFSLQVDKLSVADILVTLSFQGQGDDPATPGDDFDNAQVFDESGFPLPGGLALVIPAGEQALDFFVVTFDDVIPEQTEAFRTAIVIVANAPGSGDVFDPLIGQDTAMGWIADNDDQPE